jgi:ATP-dependent DNA helicase RecQ
MLRDMERYAASTGCRHRHLVEYFGERFTKESCSACDACLQELEPVAQPTDLARKVLSCVVRVGQRFGITHVTSVLRGQSVEAVMTRGHNTLSTFGLLSGDSVPEVRGYIEQLAAQGFLRQTDDQYPVLTLTQKGVRLLKDAASDEGLRLVRQRRPERDRPSRGSRIEKESWEGVDRDLFERLRSIRLEVARSRNVPPYVIFHDTTLRDLARRRPTTLGELRAVYGIGERKAEELGPIFVEAIRSHAGREPRTGS